VPCPRTESTAAKTSKLVCSQFLCPIVLTRTDFDPFASTIGWGFLLRYVSGTDSYMAWVCCLFFMVVWETSALIVYFRVIFVHICYNTLQLQWLLWKWLWLSEKNFHSNHCMWLKHSFKFCINVVPWQRANQLWHLNFTVQPLLAFIYCYGSFRVMTSILSFWLCKGNFVWVFTKLWKVTISSVAFVCLSVHMQQPGNHWMDFHEIWYLSIFQRCVKEDQISLKSDKNKMYLTWRACTFFIISCSFLLRMRIVSDKSCRENQNTHFIFKHCTIYKIMWKNNCGTGQATDGNVAELDRPQMEMLRAHCMLES